MNAAIALAIVGAILLGTVALGFWGVRRVHMDPQEFVVGGRSFGTLLLWVLLAGEIYSSFTFLGAAGWAYGKGAPAFYILCYGPLAYILSYFLGPAIWRVSREHRLLTSPDFFAARYGSRPLGTWVAVVSVVFTVPYTTLQLSGIQTLLRIAGYDAFRSATAVGAAFTLIILFVFLCGLRGVAWASVVKDVLVLVAVVFAGIWLPVHFFGSPAAVIDRVLALHPNWMTLDTDLSARGTTWFVSTVVLTALGFYMWPQSMAAIYSAHGEEPIRRNAMILPLYQFVLLLVYFAGWTALLLIPGLPGTRVDESFMLVVQRYYPPWVLGGVAAAGCLAGLVPASVQLLAAASILSKNVLADQLRDRPRSPGAVLGDAGSRPAGGGHGLSVLAGGEDLAGRPAAHRLQRHHPTVPGREPVLPAATPGGAERRPGHPDGHPGAGVGVRAPGVRGAWPQHRVGGAGGQRRHGRALRGRRARPRRGSPRRGGVMDAGRRECRAAASSNKVGNRSPSRPELFALSRSQVLNGTLFSRQRLGRLGEPVPTLGQPAAARPARRSKETLTPGSPRS